MLFDYRTPAVRAHTGNVSNDVCDKCGLRISPLGPVFLGSSFGGPMALPGVPGAEVCACPSEDEQLRDRIDEVEEDIDRLRRQLNELKSQDHGA
jgi:hypothetical protein